MKAPQSWKIVIFLSPLVLTLGLAMDIYLPSIPKMPEALNTSVQSVQLTLSLFLLVFGLGQLIFGPLSDQIGRKKTVLLSYVLYFLGSMICALSDSFPLFLSARMIQGLGACGTLVCAFSILKDLYNGDEVTRCFSYLKGLMGAAPITAPVIGAWLDLWFGWRASFWALTFYGALALGIFILYGKETHPESKRRKIDINLFKRYASILKSSTFRNYALVCICAQGVLFGFFSLSPHLIIGELHFREQEFSVFFGVNALCYLTGAFSSGYLLNRKGPGTVIFIGSLTVLGAGLSMFSAYLLSGFNIWTLMIPSVIASAGVAMMMGPASASAVAPFNNYVGTATALLGCIECAGGSLIGNLLTMLPLHNQLPLALNLLGTGSVALLALLSVRGFAEIRKSFSGKKARP